jgi:hypothetical protein
MNRDKYGCPHSKFLGTDLSQSDHEQL